VLAEAIWDYWDAVIAPHWPRMCGVLEGDVSHRLTRLMSDGLFGLLADLHPDVALDGQLLNIDKPQHATARFTASEMTLVPSVCVWPTVVLDDRLEGTFAVIYQVEMSDVVDSRGMPGRPAVWVKTWRTLTLSLPWARNSGHNSTTGVS
jgi:Family of unknown function (DUF5937)